MADSPERGGASESPPKPTLVPAKREVARVCAFLRSVEASSQQKEEELRNALAIVERLSAELESARRELDERTEELETLRLEYHADLRERGERIGELARDFLNQEFASQLNDMHAAIVARFEERIEQLETTTREKERVAEHAEQRSLALQQEISQTKCDATTDLENLRALHVAEREALRQQVTTLRQEVAEQYEDRIGQLETAVSERDGLFESANALCETQQQEIERLRNNHKLELQELMDRHAEEIAERDQQIEALQAHAADLEARNEQLESIIDCQVHLRTAKELEEEREKLHRAERERQEQIERLMHALRVLRDACNKSPAARSILAGTQNGIDLPSLFAVLDR